MQPLLTIAIPTWNRASFLGKCLENIGTELQTVEPGLVQLLVSDNASNDKTREVVHHYKDNGLHIDYLVSDENMGAGHNIAKCFVLSKGEFVLVLADDDLLTEGSLAFIIRLLTQFRDAGVVYLSAFGFSKNPVSEKPQTMQAYTAYQCPGRFIAKVGVKLTLISSLVINRQSYSMIDPYEFVGSQLVQIPVALRAALTSKKNVYVKNYCIAVQRDNGGNNMLDSDTDRGSRGYNPAEVFGINLLNLIHKNFSKYIRKKYLKTFEAKIFIYFLPYYIFQQVYRRSNYTKQSLALLDGRFKVNFCYRLFIRPILTLPRPFNLIYGLISIILGKIAFERPSILFKRLTLKFSSRNSDSSQ